jgi:hypothetical protein
VLDPASIVEDRGLGLKEVSMPTNTVRLHLVLRAPPERVYRAFLEADAMAKLVEGATEE